MGTQGRDGRTARRHHTGILRRGVWCASRRPPLGVRLFLPISLRSPSPILASTFVPPRGRPLLVVVSLVASSSVASLSSASSCDGAAACRSLALAARRSSALLAAYPGPSSLSSSPRARTSLLTPTAIICRPVISLLRSTLSSNTCAFTDDAGAGVPFGC